jgi:hypothetical protein
MQQDHVRGSVSATRFGTSDRRHGKYRSCLLLRMPVPTNGDSGTDHAIAVRNALLRVEREQVILGNRRVQNRQRPSWGGEITAHH